ncbi:hypothetical protein E2C01_007132 [Portunus trituberculatus]|uniref:Uncharacterized protein n=1 Tax=Portunus trituberculatus TaxID=210409 RepID=A0A5B7CX12_PORTR|nr:hypothetical protein [Portunus trituberculatus]
MKKQGGSSATDTLLGEALLDEVFVGSLGSFDKSTYSYKIHYPTCKGWTQKKWDCESGLSRMSKSPRSCNVLKKAHMFSPSHQAVLEKET